MTAPPGGRQIQRDAWRRGRLPAYRPSFADLLLAAWADEAGEAAKPPMIAVVR